MVDRQTSPTILFTAFEPSGDAHAAPVIAALKRARPEARIVAWGGPRMAAAGAEVIEHTAVDGAMGLGAMSKIMSMRAIVRRIDQWAGSNTVDVFVPVDSPAANFPVCKRMRARGVKITHLVAPQVWAWGAWRINKVRRLTDHLLCLLPFEEAWFRSRNIPATFIGHPAINHPLDENRLHEAGESLPTGELRLALFPGSRTHEVEMNLAPMLEVWREVKRRHGNVVGAIFAAREQLADLIRRSLRSDDGVDVHTIDAEAAVMWCDVALTVSGTMSLLIARQQKPMVGMYRVSRLSSFLSRFLLKMPWRLLPNIIAQREVVPEFVPYAGSPAGIIEEVDRLLRDESARQSQRDELSAILRMYEGKQPDQEAAGVILEMVEKV